MTQLTLLHGHSHSQTSGFEYKPFDAIQIDTPEVPYIEATTDEAAKSKAPIIAPHNAPGKTKPAVLEHNSYTALWADVDSGNHELADIEARLKQAGIDAYKVYATTNSKSDDKRWRVLVPLSQAVTLEQWLPLQGYLTELQGGDSAAVRIAQILYAPFRWTNTAHYQYADGTGEPLNPSNSAFAGAAIQWQQEQDAKAQQEAASATPAPRKQPSLSPGQHSPIELFCDAYSLEQYMQAHGYKQIGKKWLHPESESGQPGIVILDGRYYSHHSSDPLSDGHTHDVFDLYVHHEHGGNLTKAVQQAANDLDAEGQRQRQREYMQEQATAAPGATTAQDGGKELLASIAGAMRRAGLSQAEIEGALAVANVQRCTPPLDTKDVLRIAQSVARYEPAFDATAQMVPMERVDVAGVITDPSPPPRFVWEGLCPRGEVTLLAAHGGVGKSTIALMLAVSVATGRALFGKTVEQGAALFVSLEDPGAIVRHRLKRICEAWAIDPATLATQLHIVDGTDNPELFTADRRDGGHTTHVYDELHELCGDTNPAIVIIDNASDAYGGDEIQRRQVRAFIRTLKTLGKEHDAGVMLLSHVDKNTSRANKSEGDEGYSGSTAWNNTVRSRLFMTRESGVMLKLQHQKGNLSARMEEPIMLRWLENQLPEATTATMRQHDERAANELLAANDARVILGYMQKAIDAGEELSPARTGAYTIPKKLEPYGLNPEFRGAEGRLRFWRAFDVLERRGQIDTEDYRHNYKDRTRVVIVEPMHPEISANDDDDENDALAETEF